MNPPPHTPSANTGIPSQPPPPPPRSPSLPTVLSDLSSLLHLSDAALRSLPIPTSTTSSAPDLLPCPANPNHRLPPQSLFSHYLNCPTPISLHHNFQYPLTLHSAASATAAGVTPSVRTAASDDLSISLESYMGYKDPANGFFYQNCPGPVTPTKPPPVLNIPRDLYIECGDFDNNTTVKNALSYSVDFVKFLPSETWAIRSEIEGWCGGFPVVYSFRILRTILRLRDCKLLHLREWIVSNSPRFGVIVDYSMSDHMTLLIRLCLKVVVKDAFVLADIMSEDGKLKMVGNVLSPLRNQSFQCPVFVKVMMWLSLQFSILYGDVNGKFFVIEVLKECILNAALHASLFCSESELEKGNGLQCIALTDDTKRDEEENINSETVGNVVIFISQVAAAVAALYERSMIEEKVRALRNSRSLPAHQRNMEHEYVTKVANEERQKRLDYRPIIDHDGFLWQRSNNQDANEVKSREELLAEERDYKRRRMSYRGKKVKRNPLEVMRDIIKEYTEEIKQAGGIDDMPKTREETVPLASSDLNAQENAAGVSGSRRLSKIPEANRDKSLDCRSDLSSHHYSEGLEDDMIQPKQDLIWDHVHKYIDTKSERNRYGGDDYSGSRDGRQISTYSREQTCGRDKQGYVEAKEGSPRRSIQRRSKSRECNIHKYRDEHERNYHKREREDRDRRSNRRESSEDNRKLGERKARNADVAQWDRHEDSIGHGYRQRSTTKRSRSSLELQDFDDRYDPAES